VAAIPLFVCDYIEQQRDAASHNNQRNGLVTAATMAMAANLAA